MKTGRKSLVALFNGCASILIHILPRRRLISFYAKYYHGDGGLLRTQFARQIFYDLIDPAVRDNPKKMEEYRQLIFKDRVALVWSKSKRIDKEKMFSYYLKDGTSSCLTPIIEMIKAAPQGGWSLLDIGCGDGNCIEILMDICGQKIKRLDGIDNSRQAIDSAKKRFKTHKFWAEDIREWLVHQPVSKEWCYDIGYAHLVLQLFPEQYILDIYRLLFEKRICRMIFISDSFKGSNLDAMKSVYNPVHSGYIRFDHSHQNLLLRSGYPKAKVIADYRRPDKDSSRSMTGFVIWMGSAKA